MVTLMLCAGATALLIGPAAFHWVIYRRRRRGGPPAAVLRPCRDAARAVVRERLLVRERLVVHAQDRIMGKYPALGMFQCTQGLRDIPKARVFPINGIAGPGSVRPRRNCAHTDISRAFTAQRRGV